MPVVFQYAVKFVIGQLDVFDANDERSVVAPGMYWTAINIRNPYHYTPAHYRKKVFRGMPHQESGGASQILFGDLRPDDAHEFDRADISRAMGADVNELLKGFVVIESPIELDVVAVYTACSLEGILQAFHTERVTPRVLEVVEFDMWD